MWCQLEVLPGAGRRLMVWETIRSHARKRVHYGRQVAHKLWNDPTLIVRKLRSVLGRPEREVCSAARDSAQCCLRLEPGDCVRVKPRAQIDATLDEHGRCEGLGYMAGCMDRYCGGTYRVLKRVDVFFDERTQRMLKLKNTVLLDRVYCEPEPNREERFAGCQRMCFLFWKEAWLERADPQANADR